MNYMILINDYEIHSRKDLEYYLLYMESLALTDVEKFYHEVLVEHMEEVFQQDQKLQELVSQKISEDLISVVILPSQEGDNFDVFNFGLIDLNGEKVKRRDELFYQNLCDECFGHVPGLYSRMIMKAPEQ